MLEQRRGRSATGFAAGGSVPGGIRAALAWPAKLTLPGNRSFLLAVKPIMKLTQVAEYWEANAETWTRHARAGYDIYRDALNTPSFMAMLPPVRGLDGLDIGCGEGSNTRRLAELGRG